MNNSFKTTDPNQRRLFGNGDIGVVAGPKGKKNAICWKSIEIWNVFCVIADIKEDLGHIDKAKHHTNLEVRRLNREIWCKHICNAQLDVGPRKSWDPEDLPQGWPTIHTRSYKSITINQITDIILAHRDTVREWYERKTASETKVNAEPVAPAAAEEPEPEPEPEIVISLDSGVDDWERF
jgi:hypothetical protein